MRSKYSKIIRIFWAGILALCCYSCSSIPVSTMLRMSSMNENTLQDIDASQLRTRITLQPSVSPNLQETKLQVTLDTAKGDQQFNFPLQADLHKSVVIDGGLFSDDRLMTAHTLKLTEAGVLAFQSMQQVFKDQEADGLGLNVQVRLHKPETHVKGVMTVELQLAQSEDFFTLVDNYHYTVGEKTKY